MSWRFLTLISLCSLAIVLLVASLQKTAGYMDAEYYYINGVQIASGQGLTESIIWNFLGDPTGIPKPSHAYWMPLISFLASFGLVINPMAGYPAARLSFLLIAALIPPLTALLAMRLHHNSQLARLSGYLAIFPMFYLPFLPVTDCFGPLMILGGLFFCSLIPDRFEVQGKSRYTSIAIFGMGFLTGLMHLARADGLIWLGMAALVVVATWCQDKKDKKIGRLFVNLLICLSGYFAVMGPWFLRNIAVFGAPLAPWSSRALWIREYNELYIYPASQLTLQHLVGSGWEAILRARLWSAGQNLQTALAIQGGIFLAPLIFIGFWRLRKEMAIRIALLAWCLLFLTLTVLFPFQSSRGGFFHSGAAFQPLFWAIAPLGLNGFVQWGSQSRGWQQDRAFRVFGIGLVGLSILVTFLISYNHLFIPGTTRLAWDATETRYRLIDDYLTTYRNDLQTMVMVNNPPGFFAATARPAISIPYAGLEEVCSAAQRYHAHFLLLEVNQIPDEPELFSQPGDRLCLNYLDTIEEIHVFRIAEK